MQALLAPLAFGLLLFYALDPAVDAMEKARVPRWIGAALALGLTVGTVGAGAYALQDEAMTVINELPTGARRVVALLERQPEGLARPARESRAGRGGACKDRDVEAASGRRCACRSRSRASPRPRLLWSGSISAVDRR